MNNRKWLKYLLNEEKQEPKYDPSLSLIDERIFDALDMTSLSESQIELLMEGRRENVIRKYGDSISEAALEAILNFDEQYRYKHLAWMARELSGIEIGDPDPSFGKDYVYYGELSDAQEEKVDEIIAGIGSFVRFGQNMKKRDINQYSNLESLLNAIQTDVIQPRIDKARRKRMTNPETARLLRSSQGTVVYEDERYFVVRPDSTEASCHFGARTRWCIAQTGNNYFSGYTQGDGRVFYFIKDDTKKNEAYNYKMAVEMGMVSGELQVINIWDRDDEQYSLEAQGYPPDFAQELIASFEVPEDKAENIAEAIFEHAEENPPDSPLAEMESKIQNGHYDGGFVTLNSYLEDYDEPPYLSVSGDVRIRFALTNPSLIEMLENDQIDIYEAEDNIKEAIDEGGELYEALAEDVDIGASKYWWPDDPDSIQVDISQSGENNTWQITIEISNMRDPDYGMYSSGMKQELEQFCDYMQEEWGERNEQEILESLQNHVPRYIPEFAAAGANRFRELRSEFTSGRHDIEGDMLFYTVDDDDDENSDLNLYMTFEYDANPEYVDKLYMGTDFKNASGNTVRVAGRMSDTGGTEPVSAGNAQVSMRDGNRNLRLHIGAGKIAGDVKDNLGRAIYNVYNKAYEFATRQLKLDFGEEWKEIIEDQWELPQIPEDINIDVVIKTNSTERNVVSGTSIIIPSSAYIQIQFGIYIPFHKSETELDSVYKLFMFIKDNYDAIAAYIHKYTNQYQNFNQNIPILAENLLYRVLESKLFLEDLNNELKKYSKRRKQK